MQTALCARDLQARGGKPDILLTSGLKKESSSTAYTALSTTGLPYVAAGKKSTIKTIKTNDGVQCWWQIMNKQLTAK
jgi:uncharacterized membrane protein